MWVAGMSHFNSLSDGAIEIALETIKEGNVVYYDIFTRDDKPDIEVEQFVVEIDDDIEGEYHITLWNDEPVYFQRYRRNKAQ